MEYKVVAEEGVMIDGLEFARGEIIDLDADMFNVPELVADGSIVALEEEADDLGEEPTLPGEDEPTETTGTPLPPDEV